MKNGLIGVGEHKHPPSDDAPYYARLCVGGKQVWLGYFRCQTLAAQAYNRGVDRYKPGARKNKPVSCGLCSDCESFDFGGDRDVHENFEDNDF